MKRQMRQSSVIAPLVASVVLLMIAASFGNGQSSDEIGALKAEMEVLKQGQESIKEDLAGIKELLEALQPAKPPTFEPTDVLLTDAAIQGDANAKVTLVEFTDYQCPYCGRHFQQTYSQIKEQYVDTGKVRYALREFPLSSIHPRAAKAAEAALCAGEQGKYWEMHDLLFQNQSQLQDTNLIAHALSLELDATGFQTCLQSGKYTAQVNQDFQEGRELGITGTPSFVLGYTDPDNPEKFTATAILRGAQPLAAFQDAIDKLLEAEPGETAD